jgi:hypothetical protein
MVQRLGFRRWGFARDLLHVICWSGSFGDFGSLQCLTGCGIGGCVGVEMGVDWFGGFIEESRDNARGALRERIGVVVEDAMNNTAVSDPLGVRVDRVGQGSQALIQLSPQHLPDVLTDRERRFILLVVLEEGIATHLAQ